MRVTTTHVRAMKRRGERIAMLTAYDYPTARLIDEAGIPLILVGDSVGTAVLGYDSTVPVTLEDILHHVRAVVRATQQSLIVADMPFMTYRVDLPLALRAAARLLQEGGAQAVKMEGAGVVVDVAARLVQSGIPVMGHLGLTPQSVHQLGGYRKQARSPDGAAKLLDDARELEQAGVFSLVLEGVPDGVAREVTSALSVPTIGIGAGPHCDGQVQVLHDLIGLTIGHVPAHARQYADVGSAIRDAVRRYREDVAADRLLASDTATQPGRAGADGSHVVMSTGHSAG